MFLCRRGCGVIERTLRVIHNFRAQAQSCRVRMGLPDPQRSLVEVPADMDDESIKRLVLEALQQPVTEVTSEPRLAHFPTSEIAASRRAAHIQASGGVRTVAGRQWRSHDVPIEDLSMGARWA
jgi:hypothetical protein